MTFLRRSLSSPITEDNFELKTIGNCAVFSNIQPYDLLEKIFESEKKEKSRFVIYKVDDNYSLRVDEKSCGRIGTLYFEDSQSGSTYLHFDFANEIEISDLVNYDSLVWAQAYLPKYNKHRNLTSEEFRAEMLKTIRLEYYNQFYNHLIFRLRVIGIQHEPMLDEFSNLDNSTINYQFKVQVPIEPQIIADKIHVFINVLKLEPDFKNLVLSVEPVNEWQSYNFGFNVTSFKAVLKNGTNSIQVYTLPNSVSRYTDISVIMKGNNLNWILWDKLRNELVDNVTIFHAENIHDTIPPKTCIQETIDEIQDLDEDDFPTSMLPKDKEFIMLWRNGWGYDKLAHKYNCSKGKIGKWLKDLRKKYGVKIVPHVAERNKLIGN